MKCTLNPNVKSLSGKANGLLFKTYTRRDGTKETRAYLMPRRENGRYGYERKAALTKGEIDARVRFQNITARIAAMSDGEKQEYAQLWKKAGYKFNGKKYATLRGYIMARLYAEHKDGIDL